MFPDGLHWWERPGPGPDAPLVFLVHGVIDRSDRFAAVVDLVPEYRFVAFDRRGYGRSELAADGPRTLAGHADDLLALADALGIDQHHRATLVGHSMGGNVTYAAAHRRPEWFAAVAGYEVHAPWLDCWPTETQDGVMAIAAHPDPLALGEATYRRISGDAWWDAQPADEQARRRTEGRAYAADLGTGFATEFAFGAAGVVPCVMGNGERSQEFFVAGARRLAETLPAKYVVVPGARHAAHITHPEGFAAFIRTTVEAGRAAGR